MADITYASLYAVLHAITWGATTEPAYQDGMEEATVNTMNNIVIYCSTTTDNQPATTGATSQDITVNHFDVVIYHTSWANADAIYDLIRPAINTHTVTNGWWHVDRRVKRKHGAQYIITMQCTETLFGG